MTKLSKLLEMQRQLNEYTFIKKDLPAYLWNTEYSDMKLPQIKEWVANYCRALDDEIGEFNDELTEIPIRILSDEHKEKIRTKLSVEAIDILHFTLSIAILVSSERKLPQLERIDIQLKNNWTLFPAVESMHYTICTMDRYRRKLRNVVHWKWWALPKNVTVEEFFEEAVECIASLFETLYIIFGLLKMSSTDVLNIYSQKHMINMQRLNANYSLQTKTEADNNTITFSEKTITFSEENGG